MAVAEAKAFRLRLPRPDLDRVHCHPERKMEDLAKKSGTGFRPAGTYL
jgi:hypothetical protein